MAEPSEHSTQRDPGWDLLERLIDHLQSEIGSVTEPKFADIMRALEMKLKYGDRGRAEREFWKLAAALRQEIYGEHFAKEEDPGDDPQSETDTAAVMAVHPGSGAARRDGGSDRRCAQRQRRCRG